MQAPPNGWIIRRDTLYSARGTRGEPEKTVATPPLEAGGGDGPPSAPPARRVPPAPLWEPHPRGRGGSWLAAPSGCATSGRHAGAVPALPPAAAGSPHSACACSGACFSAALAVLPWLWTRPLGRPLARSQCCAPPPPRLQWKLVLASGDGGDCGLPREAHRACARKSGRAGRRGRRGGEAASGRWTAGAGRCQGAAGG